uniref:acetate/propionate family kinase n=2 Tax=Telluria group TaxID=2895353 RepID=UPI00351D1EF6
TDLGIRRYGFHGLSYEYIAATLPQHEPALAGARVVAAHLGNGASMCAMRGGRSVASTMGFTAVDGLPMGTRCGALDPGVVIYLIEELGMEVSSVQRLMYQESGLLGVSGLSSDMRTLEASSDPRAQLAIDLLVYRIGRELGSLAASLGGLDALVFSGGIGENSARLRAAVCRDAAWLGAELDPGLNAAPPPGVARISAPASRMSIWLVPANEELMIARHTRDLLEAA